MHYQRELPNVKHVGLFGPLNCRRSAQLKGYDDALFIDNHSHVTEGPTWNIGFFDGTQILWPKADVLPGVTLSLVKGITSGSGLTSVENVIHISQISETWAAFATNASVGVRPIHAIDEVELVDSSSVLRNLQLQYVAIPGELL
jgi:branched-subunit amino acid aminotransferase/4-amino-4-deoxychorismate lyase